jgi:hypothetical protein
VELLAKSVLDAPVEIQVGGRSVVNADITQVRPPAPGTPTLRSAHRSGAGTRPGSTRSPVVHAEGHRSAYAPLPHQLVCGARREG